MAIVVAIHACADQIRHTREFDLGIGAVSEDAGRRFLVWRHHRPDRVHGLAGRKVARHIVIPNRLTTYAPWCIRGGRLEWEHSKCTSSRAKVCPAKITSEVYSRYRAMAINGYEAGADTILDSADWPLGWGRRRARDSRASVVDCRRGRRAGSVLGVNHGLGLAGKWRLAVWGLVGCCFPAGSSGVSWYLVGSGECRRVQRAGWAVGCPDRASSANTRASPSRGAHKIPRS